MFKITPYGFLKNELKDMGWRLRRNDASVYERFLDAFKYSTDEITRFRQSFPDLPEENKRFFQAYIEIEGGIIMAMFPSPTLGDAKKAFWMGVRRADHSINILNDFSSPFVYSGYLTIYSFTNPFIKDYPHGFNKDEIERYNQIFSEERMKKIENNIDSFLQRYPQSLEEAEFWKWEGDMIKIRADNFLKMGQKDLFKIYYPYGDQIVLNAKKARKNFRY